MYNGIGLTTPRGSGTSGYIQRNLSFIKPRRLDFPKQASLSGSLLNGNDVRTPKIRKANTELLEHERRRQVEIELLHFSDKLKESGVKDVDIEAQVNLERERLLATVNNLDPSNSLGSLDSHQMAQLKEKEMERFSKALGISREMSHTKFSSISETKQSDKLQIVEDTERSKRSAFKESDKPYRHKRALNKNSSDSDENEIKRHNNSRRRESKFNRSSLSRSLSPKTMANRRPEEHHLQSRRRVSGYTK